MKFSDFEIDPRCLSVLDTQGIEEPTPVQEQSIPLVLGGKDLVATAQTGTGKTLGYVLPVLTRLGEEKNIRNRLLVLVPTRELAVQVDEVVQPFAKAMHLKCALIYGGVGYGGQRAALKQGSDVIVATPGRLLDHMGQGAINFNTLEVLILDEADRMLDMGFLPDIKRIIAKMPKKRQTLMFSATFAPELGRLSASMLHEPERVTAGALAQPVETVRQLLYPVRQEDKLKLLLEIMDEEDMKATIIFLRTKSRTDRVGRALKKKGFNAAVIHGDLNQNMRQQALEGFRSGKYDILVATDVAARGLDIDDVTHVVNYDIPLNSDDYVHRVGRTARAQREGDAITFVTPTEHSALASIEQAVGKNLPRTDREGAPPVLSTWRPTATQRGTVGRGGVRKAKGFSRRRR